MLKVKGEKINCASTGPKEAGVATRVVNFRARKIPGIMRWTNNDRRSFTKETEQCSVWMHLVRESFRLHQANTNRTERRSKSTSALVTATILSLTGNQPEHRGTEYRDLVGLIGIYAKLLLTTDLLCMFLTINIKCSR